MDDPLKNLTNRQFIMKKVNIILILIAAFNLNAQVKKTASVIAAAPSLHLQVYRNSLSAGDLATAITSLNYLVASEMKTGKYQDSLAMLYFASGNLQQANYWSNKVLSTQLNNLVMLDIKASALKQINQPLQAIETYEKMLSIDNSPATCFNLTELQYNVKRLYECVASTQLAEKMQISKDLGFSYKINEKETAQTPLIAAFYNYRGLALYDLGEKKASKIAFLAALKVDPNFILAKVNLEQLEKETAADTTPVPAPAAPAETEPIEPAPIKKY